MVKILAKRWSSGFELYDMTNAGKRGKKCQVVCVFDLNDYHPAPEKARGIMADLFRVSADEFSLSGNLSRLTGEGDFETAVAQLKEISGQKIEVSTIRGVDAPAHRLEAGLPGQWNANADEGGIVINDEVDQNNLPSRITFKQHGPTAYRLAAKVWDRVQQAKTFKEASEILDSAGCALHYFCRMD